MMRPGWNIFTPVYTCNENQVRDGQLHTGIPYSGDMRGLSNFLAAPTNHLSSSGLFASQAVINKSEPPSSGLPTGTFKRLVIGPDGQRLPSVVKKPLPLPPEDVRAIPHMRTPSRPGSPPVVTVGLTDDDGLPIPWRKSPELMAVMGQSSKNSLQPRKSSPSAEEIRQSIRDDFDSLEAFIEEAFATRNVKSN
jgi:hypothetical protein